MFYFFGVTTATDRMVGYLVSSDIVKNFRSSWIPNYQRDRIMSAKKIESLKKIFTENLPIDAIKVNLVGKVHKEDHDQFLLDGSFNVIDGQQRLYALKDSGVMNYKLPVELYINLPEAEEVKLFHQYNTAGTKLTFGEMAKSYKGHMADLVRKVLSTRSKFPLPLSVNGKVSGIPLSVYCPVLYWVERRVIKKTVLESAPTGTRLKAFLQDSEHSVRSCLEVEFAARNLAESFVELFGSYDHKATAYKRCFFLAWNHVVVNHFLTSTGKIDYNKFHKKIKEAPLKLVRNANIQELTTSSVDISVAKCYDEIIDFLNRKIHGGRLPNLPKQKGDIKFEEENDEIPFNHYRGLELEERAN